MTRRDRFRGAIAGVGTASGARFVVGHWPDSPLGSFSDVMVATAEGRRLLLAPDAEVAAYVSRTYRFDEVLIEPVAVHADGDRWQVRAGSLELDLELGRRTPLGWLLRLLPRAIATAPWFCALTDPIARIVMPGVRTRGSAGGGRREWYGAGDVHAVVAVRGRWQGADVGDLRPVDPPPDFGFSSTPRRPAVTAVTTTVEVPA